MKYETLLTRYKNLGYEVKGLSRDMEIASIIKWMYEKHDIYVGVIFTPFEKPALDMKRGFKYHSIWDSSKYVNQDFYGTNTFKSPYDALFDGLRVTYKSVKFLFY